MSPFPVYLHLQRDIMELKNKLTIEQKQALSARQIQSLDILAYTSQELEQFLTNEYLENPMLDNVSDKENNMLADIESKYEKSSSYKEQYLNEQEEETMHRADLKSRSENQLKDYLLSQLRREEYSKEQWYIFEYLIDCLNPDGYFADDISGAVQKFSCQEQAVNTCLDILKTLEPAGIFAGDLSECLQLQARAKGIADGGLTAVLEEYLPELMTGKFSHISRALDISTAQIKEYLHLITSLNPRPVMNIEMEEKEYIIPDIIVRRSGGQWEVEFNDQWFGDYKFNDYYIKMMEQTADPELAAYFRQKLERARFLVSSIEQRRNTIISIVQVLLDIQEEFLENRGALKPLRQEDVADILGIHVSTVSRAVKGKYMQYQQTMQMKDFFVSAAGNSSNDDDVSTEQIKSRIKQLIAQEEGKPLSDQKIVNLLQQEGIHISRRAAAKYRIVMGIPDSRQRALLKQ